LEEIIRIAAQTLTATETTLYINTIGAVIKTILLYNPTLADVDVTLEIDSVIFLFKILPGEVKTLDNVLKINILKATGNGINIHITGLQLEEAM